MTDQSCDTAACKGRRKKKQNGGQAAAANDENSPSRAICPPITELTCLRTDASPSLSCSREEADLASARRPSDARLHIVTDNKAASVETGSTRSSRKTSTFPPRSGRGQVGRSGGPRHLCHICCHSVDVLRSAQCFSEGETRASVNSLFVGSTVGAIWLIWQILKHLPPFVCLKEQQTTSDLSSVYCSGEIFQLFLELIII